MTYAARATRLPIRTMRSFVNQVPGCPITWEKQARSARESTLFYGLSYNSPNNPPHDKRILDEEEERRNRASQPGDSSG
jgi:hypothetical protein